MAATRYHYTEPQYAKRRNYTEQESVARKVLEKQSSSSNWLAWIMTVAAIVIGTWGGVQLSEASLDNQAPFGLSTTLGWFDSDR